MSDTPEPSSTPGPDPNPSRSGLPPWLSWTIMLGLGLLIWMSGPPSVKEKPIPEWGWTLFAIFVPTILGLMLRPIPGGAIVFIAVLALIAFQAVPPLPKDTVEKLDPAKLKKEQTNNLYGQALAGYANKSVWLVLAAYFLSRE